LKELIALVGIVYIQITQENTSNKMAKKCNWKKKVIAIQNFPSLLT
jgi:hypothetical protein